MKETLIEQGKSIKNLQNWTDQICMALMKEELIEQGMKIQNLQNQLPQMFEAVNNCPQNNWCYDMDAETDGEPEVYMQLDELKEVDIEKTNGDMENNEQTMIIPQVPSPIKLKNPVRFAHPCPIGSHIERKDLDDIRDSTFLKPWWSEEEKIEEEPVVLFMPQCKNLFTNTTEEVLSYAMEMGNSCTRHMLGGFNPKTLVQGNLPTHTAVLMDGGFLPYPKGIG